MPPELFFSRCLWLRQVVVPWYSSPAQQQFAWNQWQNESNPLFSTDCPLPEPAVLPDLPSPREMAQRKPSASARGRPASASRDLTKQEWATSSCFSAIPGDWTRSAWSEHLSCLFCCGFGREGNPLATPWSSAAPSSLLPLPKRAHLRGCLMGAGWEASTRWGKVSASHPPKNPHALALVSHTHFA